MNEFSTHLRDTIEAFHVPPVPHAAIRERARRERSHAKPLLAVYAAIILTCSAATAAFGAQVLHNLSIVFNPVGRAAVTTPTLTCQWKRVTPEMVNYVSRLATYPVVLPAGLPVHAKISMMCNAGGPDALLLFYTYPRNGHLSMLIALPDQMTVAKSALSLGVTVKASNGGGKHWLAGREEVLILGSSLTSAQMKRVELAMKSTTGH